MSVPKKIYVIDRNGRMHLVEFSPELTINDELIDTPETAIEILDNLFSERKDIKFKTNTHYKVFDSKGLIGFQVVPIHE